MWYSRFGVCSFVIVVKVQVKDHGHCHGQEYGLLEGTWAKKLF